VGKIIVCGNEKGGTGKSTTATNLAVHAAHDGLEVLLVDSDPGQESVSDWSAQRQAHAGLPPITTVRKTGKVAHKELPRLAPHYDLVIVDTGAVDSAELRGAAMVANLAVVPVSRNEQELWRLHRMQDVLNLVHPFNEALGVLLVINRITFQKKPDEAVAELRAFLEASVGDDGQRTMADMAVAPIVPIIARMAYPNAFAMGMGVLELRGREHDAKAAAESAALWHAIKAQLSQENAA
jgi:chromosome partitioning protein